MSLEAINWATKQKTGRASLKSLLFAMSNVADERGFAYPSMAYLADMTELDKETVAKGVQELRAKGLIKDSGHRVGRTKQIVVWRLAMFHAEQTAAEGKDPENPVVFDSDNASPTQLDDSASEKLGLATEENEAPGNAAASDERPRVFGRKTPGFRSKDPGNPGTDTSLHVSNSKSADARATPSGARSAPEGRSGVPRGTSPTVPPTEYPEHARRGWWWNTITAVCLRTSSALGVAKFGLQTLDQLPNMRNERTTLIAKVRELTAWAIERERTKYDFEGPKALGAAELTRHVEEEIQSAVSFFRPATPAERVAHHAALNS